MVASFSCALPRLSVWMPSLGFVTIKKKKGMNIVEALEHFGLRNIKTSKIVTIADHEQSNKSDLCFNHQTIPSVA